MRMERLTQDVRYALRTLGRDRAFTFVAVLILALGIGANVVVFSVVNTILLRPLPFYQPQNLVWIAPVPGTEGLSGYAYSVDALEDLQRMNRSYVDVTAYNNFTTADNLKLTGHGEPQPVTGIPVAGNFFDVLGVTPELGRVFTADETRSGGSAVLLSHAFWNRQFGGDRSLVGKTIRLDGSPLTVVGVMPETFDFGAVFSPGFKVDVYTAQNMEDIRSNGNTLRLIARLKPGVTLAQAQGEALALFPKFYWSKKVAASQGVYKGRDRNHLVFLKDHVSGALRQSLLVLWWAVGLILLIVCVNISNLLLARATARSKEFALRMSLGAGRARLVRQALTESLVLAGAGALLGLIFAYAATRWLAHQGSIALPLLNHVRVDGVVLGWTLMITVAVALVFGLVQGWKMSGGNLPDSLKDSGPGASGGRRYERLRGALVISEMALACVLLVGAGLLLRSFLQVMEVNLGFQASHAMSMRLDYDTHGPPIQQRAAFLQDVLQRVSAIPGVEAAGIADNLPLLRNRGWAAPKLKGKTDKDGDDPGSSVYMTTPGYFEAMGMHLHGRDFGWSDTTKSEPVTILNQKAAEALFPGDDAVGHAVVMAGKEVTIVGVVANVRDINVERASGWQTYLPISQDWDTSGAQLVLRSKLRAAVLAPSVIATVRQINPTQPAFAMRPMQEAVEHATSPRRFFAVLVGIFAGLGLLLASLGIYGVISYSVSLQTQEIGIRMALGATRERVQMGVIAKALGLALIGAAIGIVASFAVSDAIRSLLFATQPMDPVTFAGMTVLLLGVAFVAGYLPARRASRIDPMTALRGHS
jgi:predicted permease